MVRLLLCVSHHDLKNVLKILMDQLGNVNTDYMGDGMKGLLIFKG